MKVDFSSAYIEALEGMIVDSDDQLAATYIHGIGYSFLNGILEARGFAGDAFNANQGIWLAADFVGTYPKVRGVQSVNDGAAGIAGTTGQMARMVAMIESKALAAIDPDDAMSTELLHKAAPPGEGPLQPWASFGSVNNPPQDTDAIPWLLFVLNKVGMARKGRHEEGNNVFSEVSVIDKVPLHAGLTSKRYVVAWQNLEDHRPYIATRGNSVLSSAIPAVIRKTIKAYQS